MQRERCLCALSGGLDACQCLAGNGMHKQATNDLMGNPGPRPWPVGVEGMENSHIHTITALLYAPLHIHAACHAPDMPVEHALLLRIDALNGPPAHRHGH